MGLFCQVLRLKLERVLARLTNLELALACQQLAKVIVTRLITGSPFFRPSTPCGSRSKSSFHSPRVPQQTPRRSGRRSHRFQIRSDGSKVA